MTRQAAPFVSLTLLLRFTVVAIAVLSSVSTLADTWYRTIPEDPPSPGTLCYDVKESIGPGGLPDPVRNPDWMTDLSAALRQHPSCFVVDNPLPIPVGAAAALVLVVICLAGYLIGPVWRVRARGLVDATLLPGVGAELERLRQVADVRARVRFMVDLTDARVSGVTFGRLGRRHVMLSRGLLSRLHSDPEMCRAVVLHELGHVRNRDLDVSQLTVLLLRAYLSVFVVPFFLLAAQQIGSASITMTGKISMWIQLGLLAVLIVVNHHGVIRERELLADARAVEWGSVAGLSRLIETTLWTSPRRGRMARLLALHPDPRRRLEALTGTDGPGWAGPALMFAVGLTVGLTLLPTTLLGADVVQAWGFVPTDWRLPVIAVPGLALMTVPMGFLFGLTVWQSVRATPGWAGSGSAVLSGVAWSAGPALAEVLVSQTSPQGASLSLLTSDTRLGYTMLLFGGGLFLSAWAALTSQVGPGGPAAGCWVGAGTAVLLTAWLPMMVGTRMVPLPDAVVTADDAWEYFWTEAVTGGPLGTALRWSILIVPGVALVSRMLTPAPGDGVGTPPAIRGQ